jgi:hypothetical protein
MAATCVQALASPSTEHGLSIQAAGRDSVSQRFCADLHIPVADPVVYLLYRRETNVSAGNSGVQIVPPTHHSRAGPLSRFLILILCGLDATAQR